MKRKATKSLPVKDSNLSLFNKSSKRKSLDSLDQCIESLKLYPPLPVSEENELVMQMKRGDEAARQKLIRHNLRFVVTVAKKYQNRGLPLIDLIQEGSCGLIVGIEKFNPDKNVKLISYAVWWIRQHILKALSESRDVREPNNIAGLRMKVIRFRERFFSRHGHDPSTDEVAKQCNITVEQAAIFSTGGFISLDSLLDETRAEGDTLHAIIPNSDVSFLDTIELGYEAGRIIKKLKELLESGHINERAAEIFLRRVGYSDDEEIPTLEELGHEYGITRERVRQIYEKTQKLLRASLGVKLSVIGEY